MGYDAAKAPCWFAPWYLHPLRASMACFAAASLLPVGSSRKKYEGITETAFYG